MRARIRLTWVVSALLATAACTPTTAPSASHALSAAPSTSSGPVGDLPPGCEPIDIRAPTGERVDLNGEWTEVGTAGELMTWWIRTKGNCVWGAGFIEVVPPEGTFNARPDNVQSLAGVLGSDFVINGEIVWLGPLPGGVPLDPPPHTPLRMLVEFGEAGGIVLREDREPGLTGIRCPDAGGYCPAPLVLEPVD
jgi:hypothetical protein